MSGRSMGLTADGLLALIRDRVEHPASARELMQRLRVPREERATCRRLLRQLTAEGRLVLLRGRRFGMPDRMDLRVGRLFAHPAGYGFVTPDRREVGEGDVFVGAAGLHDALHGDRVVVRVERVRDGRAEGRVVKILERRSPSIVGRYSLDATGLGVVTPFDGRLTAEVYVPRGDTGGATAGEMVVVDIVRWPTASRAAVGRVTEVIGDLDEPGVDLRVIIRKHDLPDQHSPAAAAEARRMTAGPVPPPVVPARPRDATGRTDFRSATIVTIDGEHARDFDDAVAVERLANGHYWLGVHIADVAHYVRPGSALDADAYERGTSVYFPERAIHMFPEPLATGLCSLNPGVDRLVQSCLMEVDQRGEVVRAEFHDGVINTRARLTYTEVNAILTDRDPEVTERLAALVPALTLMRELFQVLNDRRRRLGSIDFDLEEPEIVLDDTGRIEAIIASERNVAHRIIEEFMLLANQTVARHLEGRDRTGLFRVHKAPDPAKVTAFEEFVTGLGHSLAAPPDAVRPHHFRALLERIRGTPEERPVAYLMLRTMQQARYDAASLGHFGLAFDSYTHYTSPIRRYPDLVVHRLLRASRGGSPGEVGDLSGARLAEIARHTSDRERRAQDAERELVEWKKVRFMAERVGDEFEGYVTGVTSFGLFVQLTEHFVEGLVHVSTMADDYYRFIEEGHLLRGANTRKTYRLGDRVRVQVLNVDGERRQIGLGLVDILEDIRRQEGRRRRARTVSATHSRGRGRARVGRRR